MIFSSGSGFCVGGTAGTVWFACFMFSFRIVCLCRFSLQMPGMCVEAGEHCFISIIQDFPFDPFLFCLPGIVVLALNGKRPSFGILIPFLAFAGSAPAFTHNIWEIIMVNGFPYWKVFADEVFGFVFHTDKECRKGGFSKN